MENSRGRANSSYCRVCARENGHAKTAKAYILYREKHKVPEMNALIGATINMFADC